MLIYVVKSTKLGLEIFKVVHVNGQILGEFMSIMAANTFVLKHKN